MHSSSHTHNSLYELYTARTIILNQFCFTVVGFFLKCKHKMKGNKVIVLRVLSAAAVRFEALSFSGVTRSGANCLTYC